MPRSFPVENPWFDYLTRRNRQTSQLAMLLLVTLVAGGVSLFFKRVVFTMPGLALWIVLHWVLMELLWCWMAADHIFSTVGLARRRGMLTDLRLSTLPPQAMVHGLTHSTANLLLIGIVAWSVATALVPFPEGRTFDWADYRASYYLWQYGMPVVFLLNGWATARWACAASARGALGEGSHGAWARTLWSLALQLSALALAGFAAYIVGITILGWWIDSSGFYYLEESIDDHLVGGAAFVWFAILTLLFPAAKVIYANRQRVAAEMTLGMSRE